jgi:hypothetical protein
MPGLAVQHTGIAAEWLQPYLLLCTSATSLSEVRFAASNSVAHTTAALLSSSTQSYQHLTDDVSGLACTAFCCCRAVTWGYAITAAICTLLGAFGYALYGSSTAPVITASLPPLSFIALLCTCLTLCNPFSAFALTLEPVALALQQQLGSGQQTPYPVRATIRLGKTLVD